MKELVKRSNGDIKIIREALGANWESFADMRIQVYRNNPFDAGCFVPDGNVAGTDLIKWEPGGLTPGKVREVSGPPINGDFVETYSVGEFMLKFIP